ncbi:hypothetical protein F9K94_21310 [Brucella tritici]|uniref:Uncharacterized protein n=1 Tax=Brucella tritici TaxID=94626 RepID=A0A7V7VR22_9HYPH|nr:hypothetical protein [Brucella tritici]KAB2655098.1 hypothetical protein F9K94_21310 [Brucella tritici]
MALKLRPSQTVADAEVELATQEALAADIRRAETVHAAVVESDQQLSDDSIIEDDLSLEELEQVQANLEAEMNETAAQNAALDAKREQIKRTNDLRTEGIRISNMERQMAQEAQARLAKAEDELRQRRLDHNLNPTPFKDLESNRQLIESIRQKENKPLSSEQRKQLQANMKTAFAEVDNRIVDYRNANFASAIKPGATKVFNKDVGKTIHAADKASAFIVIRQMQARKSHIQNLHNERVNELKSKADEARKFDREDQASYYEKRIAYEELCYERDTAHDVLAKYEHIDGRSDSDRCKEQLEDIKQLEAQADAIQRELATMKEYEVALEQPRVVEVADHDLEVADAEADKSFADIEYAMSKDEADQHDQAYEVAMTADADRDEDDPYLVEARAEQALEEHNRKLVGDEETPVDDDDYLMAELRAEQALEEHIRKMESDADEDQVEIDPDNLKDSDDRFQEDLDSDVETEEAHDLTYDMHGRMVEEPVEVEVDAEIENVDIQEAELESEVSIDDEIQAEVEIDAMEMDVEEAEIEADLEEPEIDVEQPEIELEADVDEIEDDIEIQEPEVEVEQPDVDADEPEIETEAEADAEVETDVESEMPDQDIETAEVDASKPASEIADTSAASSVEEINRQAESEASTIDDKITSDFKQASVSADQEYEQATESGDIDAILEAEDKKMALNQEFNDYMNDRKTFDGHMSAVREAAADYAKAETNEEKATAADKYAEAHDQAQATVSKAKVGDKSYADTMEKQFHGEVQDQMSAIRKSEPDAEMTGIERAVEERQSEGHSVRVTMQDVEETKAIAAHSQSQIAQQADRPSAAS